MEALEGGKRASVLLGVDYEKAFNHMEHAVCLEQLERLGASPKRVAMVKAFLENMTMTISLGALRLSQYIYPAAAPREAYWDVCCTALSPSYSPGISDGSSGLLAPRSLLRRVQDERHSSTSKTLRSLTTFPCPKLRGTAPH